jgi:hypothetical protein
MPRERSEFERDNIDHDDTIELDFKRKTPASMS